MVRDHGREPARGVARGCDVVADDRRGAHDRLERIGIAPGFRGGGAGLAHDPVDDVGVSQLDHDAVALTPGHAERPGAVAGHPDRDLGQTLGPLERDLLPVPVGGAAVRELADQLGRGLELAHLDGLQPDRATRRVAAPDLHRDAPGRHRVERRVEARSHGRVARARIGDAEPEADALGLRGRHGQEDGAVLPKDVRVVGVGPVVPRGLGGLHELDEARAGRVGEDRDAELQRSHRCKDRAPATTAGAWLTSRPRAPRSASRRARCARAARAARTSRSARRRGRRTAARTA